MDGFKTARAAIVLGAVAAAALGSACVNAETQLQPTYTFELIGGYFYGPGPVEPDTSLPNGKLRNIRFDTRAFRGYCEFANDGTPAGLLSDGRTRINQNIEAGRLMIGGGTSPVYLTAVDGGPHNGTEQYYLDEKYRFVWRVDIALDPGFPEGIIRLEDFLLDTGVSRIARSLQTLQGQPGGYDQAGSLKSGEYLAGRVGDFDQDNFLDGILIATPNVPMVADMLAGAPVGNRRGFRTNVPIAAQLSAELILRGATLLHDAIATTIAERTQDATRTLLVDLEERLRVARERTQYAIANEQWPRGARRAANSAESKLGKLHAQAAALLRSMDAEKPREIDRSELRAMFATLDALISNLASLNARSNAVLATTRVARDDAFDAARELRRR